MSSAPGLIDNSQFPDKSECKFQVLITMARCADFKESDGPDYQTSQPHAQRATIFLFMSFALGMDTSEDAGGL